MRKDEYLKQLVKEKDVKVLQILKEHWAEFKKTKLDNYPNIFKSYEDAKKAYGMSDAVGCLTHCRNIITGFCTYMKDEQTEWLMGLKEVCKRDKNILQRNIYK